MFYIQYTVYIINNCCAYIDTLHLGSVQWFTFTAIDFPTKNTKKSISRITSRDSTHPSNPKTLGIPCSLRYVQASSKRPPPQPLLVRSHCTKSSGAKDRPCKSWKKWQDSPRVCYKLKKKTWELYS